MKTVTIPAKLISNAVRPVAARSHAALCDTYRMCNRSLPPPLRNPWEIRLVDDATIVLRNVGDAPLFRVRLQFTAAGVLGQNLPANVLPGEELSLRLRGGKLRRLLQMRGYLCQLQWFTKQGVEYFFPVSL